MGEDGQPGRFIQVNDAACRILGYTKEEMLRLSPQDVDSIKIQERAPALIEKLIKNNHVLFETEMVKKKRRYYSHGSFPYPVPVAGQSCNTGRIARPYRTQSDNTRIIHVKYAARLHH
jgi:PAS domain-containing protein